MFLRESLEESIKELVKFEFGPPSADTILRVFRNVNADKIEKVFYQKEFLHAFALSIYVHSL